jgi:UDP-N-acetylmuramate dehydrogenase
MHVLSSVSLKLYSTMRLGGTATYLVEVSSTIELQEALQWAKNHDTKIMVIGEGSNIVWRDEGFDGLIIVNKILGLEKIDENDTSATYKIGAGEAWDSIVSRLTAKGLSGIETLSLIPGTAGATPVQNVGAYGSEISQTLMVVEAYDNKTEKFITIDNPHCQFGYRTSRFKTTDKGRFIIVNISLKLKKTLPTPPFYAVLEAYLEAHHIYEFTPLIIRNAVIAIRSEKMPDWHKVANNGSFFANPIVEDKAFQSLQVQFPKIVGWEYEGKYKISAGWLLETAGFKGYEDKETGMATSDKQALVLINNHAKTTADLLKFKQKIVSKVELMFGIKLEQEPELLP